VVRESTSAVWELGMPPDEASRRKSSRRCRSESSATLRTWAISQAVTGIAM
jgi:hypothetical protein